MNRSTYYRICERCGSNLDPGERCECDTVSRTERAPEKTVFDLYEEWSQRNSKVPYAAVRSA